MSKEQSSQKHKSQGNDDGLCGMSAVGSLLPEAAAPVRLPGTSRNHFAACKFSRASFTRGNTVYMKFNMSEFTKDRKGNIEVYSLNLTLSNI